MSDSDNRKSMDDVLASIRRIVRSEKEPVSESAPTATDVGTAAETDEGAADAPLELTPSMRMDDYVEDQDAPVKEDQDEPVEDATIVQPDPPEMADVPAAPAISTDEIRTMVREVVLEQLSGDDAGRLVRDIIKDELVNGEIGSNISNNVMALIQSEIAKAVTK